MNAERIDLKKRFINAGLALTVVGVSAGCGRLSVVEASSVEKSPVVAVAPVVPKDQRTIVFLPLVGSEEVSVRERLLGDVDRYENSFLVKRDDETLTVRSRRESFRGSQEEIDAWKQGRADWSGNLVEMAPGILVTPWQEIEGIGIDGMGRADRRVFEILIGKDGKPVTEIRYGVEYVVLGHYNQAMPLGQMRDDPTGGLK